VVADIGDVDYDGVAENEVYEPENEHGDGDFGVLVGPHFVEEIDHDFGVGHGGGVKF